MTKTEIYNNLEVLRNKGAVYHCRHKAEKVLYNLKPFLSSDDYFSLSLGYHHFISGEGHEEFYDACKVVIDKYKKGYPQSR